MDGIGLGHDRDEDAHRADEWQQPAPAECRPQPPREQRVRDEKEQEAEREQDEVVGHVARARHRDGRLNREEHEERGTRESQPQTDATPPGPGGIRGRALRPALLSRLAGRGYLGYLRGQKERLLGRRSPLPDRPDRAAVDRFLVDAYRRHWGW